MRSLITTILTWVASASLIACLILLHGGTDVPALTWAWIKTWPGLTAVGAVGAALLAALINIDRAIQYLTVRRLAVALNVFVMCALAVGLIVVANVIASRRYAVFDVTFKKYYTLSERTQSILEKLPRKVTAHVFVHPASPQMLEIRGLLDAYRAAAPEMFAIEFYNPGRDRKKFDAAVQRLGIDPKKMTSTEVVIFEGETPDAAVPRTKYVGADELFEKDYSTGEERTKGFKGEEQFTKAILDVSREKQTKIYFLSGHQELDTFGQERIQALDGALRNLDYDVETLKLDFAPDSKMSEVPQDCDVLAIIGPKGRFDDREIAALKAYLERGGRLLLMAEPVVRLRPGTTSVYFEETRLDLLLKDYGLSIEPALIHDSATAEADWVFATAVDGVSSAHPITRPLLGLAVFFAHAVPVTVLPPSEERTARAQSILETLPSAVAVKDLDAVRRGRAPEAVADKKGPITLVATAEKKIEGGKEARLVVTGDATFATDELTMRLKAQLDLVLNAVGWLAERDESISIDSKPPDNLRLQVGERELSWLKFMSLVEIPLACAAVGFFVWAARRR